MRLETPCLIATDTYFFRVNSPGVLHHLTISTTERRSILFDSCGIAKAEGKTDSAQSLNVESGIRCVRVCAGKCKCARGFDVALEKLRNISLYPC